MINNNIIYIGDNMRLSDLQEKDIVNINDGRKIGKIIDAEIDENGKILYLLIEEIKGLRKFITKDYATSITFTQIKKIGSDVILIDLWYNFIVIVMKKKIVLLSLIPFIVDQIIKVIVSISVKDSVVLIPNILRITYVTNTGAAWSILNNHLIIISFISAAAIILLLSYMNHFKMNKRNKIAFVLLYGGIISNLFDRVFYGYVIDYIDLNINYPIFNLADTFIVIGIVLIIIAIIKKEDEVWK